MAAYLKKYSKNIMSMIVVFTFVAALFCPSDNFWAATEVGSNTFSFSLGGPGITATEQYSSTPFEVDIYSNSYELAGFNYDWSDVGISYFEVSFTDKSSIGSGQLSDVNSYLHPYILYGGQKYYLYRFQQGTTSVYRGFFAIPTSGYSYSVGVEVSGSLYSSSTPNYYVPLFSVSVHNIFYTFTDAELTALYGNSEIVSVLRDQVVLSEDIIDDLEELIDEQKKSNSFLSQILNKLNELFNMLGGEGMDEASTEEMDDLKDKEDALIGEVKPEDAVDDLVVTIDSNGSNLLWTVFDNVITANPDVFTAFISLLSLGVVALILNR